MGVVKYGQVSGSVVTQEFQVAASQVFKHLGGAFMDLNTSGMVEVADASATDLIGWAFTGDFTASSTAGNTRVAVNLAHDAVYEMPCDTALTEAECLALVGEFHDLIVTSNIQYVNHDATSTNVIQIVGYRYYGSALGQQSLLVKLVVKNLTTAA